jgi:hypothetical protein
MDDVMAGFYTDSKIQGIERCRLYLPVECLSAICTPDGVRLDPGIQEKHLQSLQRARFSGRVKVFQAHARGQYGYISSKPHTRFSVQSATANIGLMDQTQPSGLEHTVHYEPSSQMLC